MSISSYFTGGKRSTPSGSNETTSCSSSKDSNDRNKEIVNTCKRKLQTNAHFCLKCHKTISRGNPKAKSRHQTNHHKEDPTYDCNKFLLPTDHFEVKKVKKRLGLGNNDSIDVRKEVNYEEVEEEEGEIYEIPRKKARIEENVEKIPDVDHESEIEELHDPKSSLIEIDDLTDSNPKPSSPSNSALIQSVIEFEKELPEEHTEENTPSLPLSLSDVHTINKKLDFLMEKLTIGSNVEETESPTEAVQAVNVLKKASSILDIHGSGITFYPGHDEGLVRCDICFANHCEKHPDISPRDPFFLGHTNNVSIAGNTLAMGLIICSESKKSYVEGHNQKWYRFKKTLIDHVSCASSNNGGKQHYEAIIAKQKRDRKNNTIQHVVCNQLKATLTTVKVKAASLHYENMIGLLDSCGANVGNLGHGRKQVNPMLKAFQAHSHKKLHGVLTTSLPSTGLPPHYSTSSDKSTPIRESNHAIMILVMIDGVKTAIPISAPPVYDFSDEEIIGGKADHLADQVISALIIELKIPETLLSYLVGHQADGQYQAPEFIARLKDRIYSPHEELERNYLLDKYFVVPWDVAHWLDCCFTDIRKKEKDGEIFRRLVKRVNKFNDMFGRGKGHAEYVGFTKEKEISSFSTKNYSTTRFSSSAFETLQKVYAHYEGLIKVYNRYKETAAEEDEIRFMIKGRDFCIDLCGILDILSPLMTMMIRVQAVDNFIWSVTKYWPKIRNTLTKIIEQLEIELDKTHPVFSSHLFPKLSEHFPKLNFESAFDCEFQGVSLTPGWMLVEDKNETASTGKTKFIWEDRLPEDCIKELHSFAICLVENMDARYKKCVTPAAHTLGNCLYIPDICFHIQGNSQHLTALQLAALQEHGKEEFSEFYSYVCSLPHIQKLQNDDSKGKFIPILSLSIYSAFKEVIAGVVWQNLGNCRANWFAPIDKKNTHGDSLLEFQMIPGDLDTVYEFHYEMSVCKTRFDEVAAFRSLYVNENLYQRLGKEMCISIDIAIAMSGSEAVVESYYSVMNTQVKSGCLQNESLVLKTNIDWCYPFPSQCYNTINEVAEIYIKGDENLGLRPHQVPVFVDDRGRALRRYKHGSKVLDRLHQTPANNFVLSEKDK